MLNSSQLEIFQIKTYEISITNLGIGWILGKKKIGKHHEPLIKKELIIIIEVLGQNLDKPVKDELVKVTPDTNLDDI